MLSPFLFCFISLIMRTAILFVNICCSHIILEVLSCSCFQLHDHLSLIHSQHISFHSVLILPHSAFLQKKILLLRSSICIMVALVWSPDRFIIKSQVLLPNLSPACSLAFTPSLQDIFFLILIIKYLSKEEHFKQRHKH